MAATFTSNRPPTGLQTPKARPHTAIGRRQTSYKPETTPSSQINKTTFYSRPCDKKCSASPEGNSGWPENTAALTILIIIMVNSYSIQYHAESRQPFSLRERGLPHLSIPAVPAQARPTTVNRRSTAAYIRHRPEVSIRAQTQADWRHNCERHGEGLVCWSARWRSGSLQKCHRYISTTRKHSSGRFLHCQPTGPTIYFLWHLQDVLSMTYEPRWPHQFPSRWIRTPQAPLVSN